MNNCQTGDKASMVDITVADTTQEVLQGYQTSTIIHPAFLEQLIEMYGMNQKDLTAAMGQLDKFDFGVECSGIITKKRRKVSNVVVGDRVAEISISQEVTLLLPAPTLLLRSISAVAYALMLLLRLRWLIAQHVIAWSTWHDFPRRKVP
jgi:hypothetical protein